MKPTVGMPVTICHPNDRYAAVVVAIRSTREIGVQYDGRESSIERFTLRKNGEWIALGKPSPRLRLGVAENYRCREI